MVSVRVTAALTEVPALVLVLTLVSRDLIGVKWKDGNCADSRASLTTNTTGCISSSIISTSSCSR